MNEYTPDKWIILKFTYNNDVIFKVLAGWSGSYLCGQSWKLNSGITKIEIENDYYLFYGYSGSIYKCHKHGYGTNLITASTLESFKKQIKDSAADASMEVIEFKDVEHIMEG